MAGKIAFALAGLGGFNAHGAGFLKAASELGVAPDLVTATSGQIVVLAEWIRGKDLATLLIDPQRPSGIFGTMLTAVTGDPGIFRPAIQEYWARWWKVPGSLMGLSSWTEMSRKLFPAEEYVPLRSKEYLRELAKALNGAAFGVVFNAYEPATGKGVLYGNTAADGLLPDIKLELITAEALDSALWLSLYGFARLPKKRMDGAYLRPCVVAELSQFDTIFAVRPLAEGWRGQLPESWFDVQDWQTEMWFSSGFKAEVADMKRINDLIDEGSLKNPQYKKIDLIEVCTHHPAGYFNFFTERPQVFEAAYKEAKKKLAPFARP